MITSKSVEETLLAGAELAKTLRGGEVIALQGDLGAGKTHFVKGLAQGLGFDGDITSPTFSLVHEYRGGRLDCFHFDFYRLKTVAELDGIGFQDYLDENSGICVIEWAERFPEALPVSRINITIEIPDHSTRNIRIGDQPLQ